MLDITSFSLVISIKLFFFSFLLSRFYCFSVSTHSNVVINLSLLFWIWSSSHFYGCIYAILKAGESSSSLLSWHKQSISSLEYKAVWIIFNFLVLWSICLSTSYGHLKNGLLYSIRATTQVFITLKGFLQKCLVLRIFLSLLLLRWCQLSEFLSIYRFPSLYEFSFFHYFSFSTFHHGPEKFFNTKFHSYILTVCFYCLSQVVEFFFIFCKYVYIVNLHKMINIFFFFDFVNLWPLVHFLSTSLSGIIYITKINFLERCVRIFPTYLIVNFTFQFSIVFMMQFMILYILRDSIIQVCGTIS